MPARNSEIRRFLLRYAEKEGIRIQEHISDWRDGPTAFYCHLQVGEDPLKTATAVSYEHFDNALVMAFLALGNAEIDFI